MSCLRSVSLVDRFFGALYHILGFISHLPQLLFVPEWGETITQHFHFLGLTGGVITCLLTAGSAAPFWPLQAVLAFPLSVNIYIFIDSLCTHIEG